MPAGGGGRFLSRFCTNNYECKMITDYSWEIILKNVILRGEWLYFLVKPDIYIHIISHYSTWLLWLLLFFHYFFCIRCLFRIYIFFCVLWKLCPRTKPSMKSVMLKGFDQRKIYIDFVNSLLKSCIMFGEWCFMNDKNIGLVLQFFGGSYGQNSTF